MGKEDGGKKHGKKVDKNEGNKYMYLMLSLLKWKEWGLKKKKEKKVRQKQNFAAFLSTSKCKQK